MAIHFNIIDIIITIFMFTIILVGTPVYLFRKYLPAYAVKLTLNGNLGHTETEVKAGWLASGGWLLVEISKSYYRYMYIFGSIFSISSLFYMVSVYFFNVNVNEYVKLTLKTLIEDDEPVSVITTLTVMVLCILQLLKRTYETVFMQVFSKSSKMPPFHFFVASIHYVLYIMSIVGRGPLFCGEQTRNNMTWIDIKTKILIAPCILLYLYALYEQFRSHVILANLRKSKETGSVVSDAYHIPYGGLFRYTSSPHRLCEVLIYLVVALLMRTRTHTIIFVWVLTNQIQTALEAHRWYKNKFEDYPSDRFALVPYLI